MDFNHGISIQASRYSKTVGGAQENRWSIQQRGRSSIVKMGMFIGDVNQARKPGCNQWTMDVSRIFLRRYLPRGQPWTGFTLKKMRFKPENKINICLYIGVYRVYYQGFGNPRKWVVFNVWPCGDQLSGRVVLQNYLGKSGFIGDISW